VCTGGRRVVLRRAALREPYTTRRSGLIVRAASAAGRRVAWIEARLRRGSRTIAVHVASVSERGVVRRLRRVVVKRDALRHLPELGVVITRGAIWPGCTRRSGTAAAWWSSGAAIGRGRSPRRSAAG
jgi:hypothetical protein